MPGNQYTTKLYDLITPADESDFSYLFIVQEYMQTDLKKVFSSMPQLTFTEDHMISILYNMLLAMNFIHTSNIMHRDIKPANILVDVDCSVKICDFGLGRTLPTPEEPRGRKSRLETAAELLNKREARMSKQRDLSNHVVSRWYRAPEIILVEKQYDTSIDMWSVGCILSEMISCTEQYSKNGVDPEDRFLFTGTSCFPLSPCDKGKSASKKKNVVSKNDQLNCILNILGAQDQIDTSFITDESAVNYVTMLKGNPQKIDFKKEFPFTSPEVLEILENLLEFNPYLRKSPADLLKSSIFDNIRKPE